VRASFCVFDFVCLELLCTLIGQPRRPNKWVVNIKNFTAKVCLFVIKKSIRFKDFWDINPKFYMKFLFLLEKNPYKYIATRIYI
jgi:hypothetical protein